MQSKKEVYLSKIEEFINDYVRMTGNSPSMREIGEAIGLPKSSVQRYLLYMKENGMLSYSGTRNIQTKHAGRMMDMLTMPVCGQISCGIENLAEEDIEDYISLPKSMFGVGNFFILKAHGDSMINAGIENGDLVVIRQQADAEPGQIIVPLIDGDFSTLKRYRPHREEGIVELVPENDAYEPIIVDLKEKQFAIQGIAIKVLKISDIA